MSQLDPTPAARRAHPAGDGAGSRHRSGRALRWLTRLVRRFVGRAVKYERDFNLQIDVALLERLHEIETSVAEQLRRVRRRAAPRARATTTAARDRRAAARQRPSRAARLEAHRTRRGARALLSSRSYSDVDSSCGGRRRSAVADVRRRRSRATARARTRSLAVRPTACGSAEAAVGRAPSADKAAFVYDEMTARAVHRRRGPRSHYTDARGRARLGYRGVRGPSPLYAGFEDIFRGSEALVRDRQRVYLDVIGDRGPVVDLGCGRGEMLELLAASRHRRARRRSRRGDGRPGPRRRRRRRTTATRWTS